MNILNRSHQTKFDAELDFGIYNIYNRRKSYFYTLDLKRGENRELTPILQSVSLLPILPYVSVKAFF